MEVTIASYGLVGKPASFFIKISDGLGNEHIRKVPIKSKSKYQAELHAIEYAMHAVKNKKVDLNIKTSMGQLAQMFKKSSDGRWPKRKKPNKMVQNLQKMSEEFNSFTCTADPEDDDILMMKLELKSSI